MCCQNKCFFFIKVRTGSLIFGYIGAVLSGLAVLACTAYMLYLLTAMASNGNGSLPTELKNVATQHYVVEFIFNAVAFIDLTAAFICTVFLLCGITKNKPALVKTYVIYGMIQLSIFLAIVIILFCKNMSGFGVITFFVCGIYLMILNMVYLTYKDMINPPSLLMNA